MVIQQFAVNVSAANIANSIYSLLRWDLISYLCNTKVYCMYMYTAGGINGFWVLYPEVGGDEKSRTDSLQDSTSGPDSGAVGGLWYKLLPLFVPCRAKKWGAGSLMAQFNLKSSCRSLSIFLQLLNNWTMTKFLFPKWVWTRGKSEGVLECKVKSSSYQVQLLWRNTDLEKYRSSVNSKALEIKYVQLLSRNTEIHKYSSGGKQCNVKNSSYQVQLLSRNTEIQKRREAV